MGEGDSCLFWGEGCDGRGAHHTTNQNNQKTCCWVECNLWCHSVTVGDSWCGSAAVWNPYPRGGGPSRAMWKAANSIFHPYSPTLTHNPVSDFPLIPLEEDARKDKRTTTLRVWRPLTPIPHVHESFLVFSHPILSFCIRKRGQFHYKKLWANGDPNVI